MPAEFELLSLIGSAAFFTACLSYFLDFCFEEGNIFESWLPFIARVMFARRGYYYLPVYTKRDEIIADAENKLFWFKPLGGCIVCSNIWQALIVWPFWMYVFGISFIWLLPYLVLSNFLVRKMI